MSKKFVQQLQALRHGKVSPAPEWLQKNRALLLSQIKNTVSAEAPTQQSPWENIWSWLSIFIPRDMVYNVVRPLAVLFIAALVGTSGWIASVDAAYDAMPGDGMAYFVKRGIEKTQVAVISLIGDQDAQTKVHLKLAASRANEVKKMLVRTNMPAQEKHDHVVATVAELKQEINTVNDNISVGAEAQFVKEVASDVKQIKNVLQDAKDTMSVSSTPELAQEVKVAKDLAKDVSVKAVESLVNKHLAGDQSVSAEEVTQIVSSTLQSVADDAVVSKQTAEGVKTAVDAAKSELKDLTNTASASTSTISTSSAKEIKDLTAKISAVETQTTVVAGQVKQVNDDVTKQVSDAKSALSNGDLATVMGTIKDVTQVTKTVEQLTDSALQQAQAALPALSADRQGVQVVKVGDAVSAASSLVSTSSTTSTLNTSSSTVSTTSTVVPKKH